MHFYEDSEHFVTMKTKKMNLLIRPEPQLATHAMHTSVRASPSCLDGTYFSQSKALPW